jgi:hypothetical protein
MSEALRRKLALIAFILDYIAILAMFAFNAQWVWLSFFVGLASLVLGYEAWAISNKGKAISALFWIWQELHSTRAQLTLILMLLGVAFLVIHLW